MEISLDLRQIILIIKNISKYFIDIGRFIFLPKEYFQIVLKERPINNLKRLVLYAVGFDLLVFCLFYSVTESSGVLDPFKFSIKLFGIAVLEIVWGLLVVPPLVLTGQFCKPKMGLTISIIYSLTFKFVYLLIPMIFYALFILTENYVFAVLKGVFYYGVLIGIFLCFPFLFSVGLKRRVLTVVISLSSSFLTIVVLAYALSYFPHNFEKIKQLTVIYDPIASEIDKTEVYAPPSIEFPEFNRFFDIVRQSISRGEKRKDGYVVISLKDIKSGGKQLQTEWHKKGKSSREELEKELQQVESHLKSAKYSTTREFLNLKEDEIKSGLIFISKVDELLKEFNSDPSEGLKQLSNTAKLQTEYLKKGNTFLIRMNDYWRALLLFRKYWIIIY